MKMKSPLACRWTAVGVHILCLSFSLGNGESCRASVLMVVVVVFRVAVFMVVLMADHQVCDRKWRFLSKPVSGSSALIQILRGFLRMSERTSRCVMACRYRAITFPPEVRLRPQTRAQVVRFAVTRLAALTGTSIQRGSGLHILPPINTNLRKAQSPADKH